MHAAPARPASRRARRLGAGAVVLATAVLGAAAAVATASGVRHTSSRHFAVEFPAGWVRVPDAAAKEYADGVARLMGTRPSFEAFYERADATEHFAYPYVMVDFHAGDTRTYREFERQMEKGFESAAEGLSSRTEGFLDGIEFGKPVLEAALSRLWVKMKMDVAGTSVTGLSLLKMGSQGIAVVNFYAETDDFAAREAEFRTIADTCRFEAGFRHDPSAGPPFFSTFWGRILLFGAIGGAIGALGGIARWRASRVGRRVRLEPYAPPPPGAPLSRPLLDPAAFDREAARASALPAAAPPPSPRPVAVTVPSRAPLPSEDPGLLDPNARRFAPRPRPPTAS
jgi:hypothetical protein